MSNSAGYGNTKLIVAWIISLIVVFAGTLLFAQATWKYKVGGDVATAQGGAAIQPATQPATQPGRGAARQPAKDDDAKPASGTDVVDHGTFDDILAANVRKQRIDYLNIRDNRMDALEGYLNRLANVQVSALSRNEQLAYYTNLYNATMIKAVIDRYHEGYSPSDNDFAVFSDKLVRMKDEAVSLDHLEKQIMLKKFDEPRIHVVLVCAAVSCPPLLPKAYTGDNIERLMEQNMHRFINESTRNEIRPEQKLMKLSAIFDWYAEDFGGPEQVDDYVNRYYEGPDVRGIDIEFLEYSWELNIVRD